MTVRWVFFDLDDTLYMDRATTAAVFAATCELAADCCGTEPGRLEDEVRKAARRRWMDLKATYGAIDNVGMSSWASLWMPFPRSNDPEWAALRAHAAEHRLGSWLDGLTACGVPDPALAELLATAFVDYHFQTFYAFPGAYGVIDQLAVHFRLGMITNGPVEGQRLKLIGIELLDAFEPLVISEEVGRAKPDPRVFEAALARAGVRAEEAVMVGDSLERDVNGARALGMMGIWLHRDAREPEKQFRGHRPRDLEGVARVLLSGLGADDTT